MLQFISQHWRYTYRQQQQIERERRDSETQREKENKREREKGMQRDNKTEWRIDYKMSIDILYMKMNK